MYLATIPIFASECEKEFSQMNLISLTKALLRMKVSQRFFINILVPVLLQPYKIHTFRHGSFNYAFSSKHQQQRTDSRYFIVQECVENLDFL
jgi:hypothetical protein